MCELATGKMDHHAGDSPVAHEQIRPTTHDHQRDVFVETKPHEVGKPLLGFRLRPELCGASDTHRRVFGKRFVKFDATHTHDALQLVAFFQIINQAGPRFVDIARAEAQNEIALFENSSSGLVHF